MKKIWDAINDGTIYSCPSLLASFVVLSFADLKKYKFSYWFAFPAIHSKPVWRLSSSVPRGNGGADSGSAGGSSSVNSQVSRKLTSQESTTLVEAVQTWRYEVDARQYGFFLAKKVPRSMAEGGDQGREEAGSELDFEWRISTLSSYEADFFNGSEEQDCFVCFADPSNYDDAPGWVLRNLLALVQRRWKLRRVQLLRYRDVHSRRDQGRSVVMTLETDDGPTPETDITSMPKVTGWERNSAGKLSGRTVDLKEYMDPKR